MRHDRDPYRDHQYVPDTFWLVVATLLFAACGLVWLIGQVAAILFGAHQHLQVRLVDIQRLFAALVIQPIADAAHRLRWSFWRRRHQARARTCHYHRQANRP